MVFNLVRLRANIMLNGRRLKTFPLSKGTKVKCLDWSDCTVGQCFSLPGFELRILRQRLHKL